MYLFEMRMQILFNKMTVYVLSFKLFFADNYSFVWHGSVLFLWLACGDPTNKHCLMYWWFQIIEYTNDLLNYMFIFTLLFCLASFCETCQWLKFPLNGLWAQSRVSPAVGLLPLASGPACLGMAFPPFLVKQL